MNEEMKNIIADALSASEKAYDIFDLSDRLNIPVDMLQTALNQLCAEGRAAITKKGKYAAPELLGMIPARVVNLRSGAPVAHPLNGDTPMKIHVRTRLSTMPDDIVLVRETVPGDCEVISILKRGMTELAAFIRVEQRELRRPRGRHDRRHSSAPERRRIVTGIPCDRRIPYSIEIMNDDELTNDTIALLAIDRYPESDMPILAHVVRILGRKSDMQARLKVIAETHEFATEFSDAVEKQCRSLTASDDTGDREDLRNLLTFTIDGPFSKDFDDAVSLERCENGDWQLGVHIADVSHYVRPGSPIDREAYERGTSLYLPGLTIPMLPEILSNDLCSLMPGVDRLALSCFMTVRGGKIIDHRLCRSVIHSHARLTYDAVNRFLDGDENAVDAFLHGVLRDMLDLSRSLRKRRFAAGCIELDLPETEFVLDEENVPTDILSAERGEAERIIEDFMLAANETVAQLARTTSTPLVYRVHEDPDPDKLHELGKFLNNLNVPVHIGAHPHPGILQKIIEDTRGHEGRDTIRRMLLRSLQRAQYSEKPLGHYALALEDYCHFTSPIRRYPDLIVHRMLKQLMDGKSNISGARMGDFAKQSSLREQEATLAEREADDLLKARYMRDRIGRKYSGVISSVTSWGMYVTLPNTVEGLVHIASLDDYYDYDRERSQLVGITTRNVFGLGDRVRIQVDSVDLDRAEINFVLVPYR